MSPGRESPVMPSRYRPTDTILGVVVEIVLRLSSVIWESAAITQRSFNWIPTNVVIGSPFLWRKDYILYRRVAVNDTPVLITIPSEAR